MCRACDSQSYASGKGLCSFPTAHIKLAERQRFLMLGQLYKVHIELEMPESQKNRELGMFMVCADFHGERGTVLATSCRSMMLHYKSFLIDFIYKLVFIPFYIFGGTEEKQNLHLELFSDYHEDEVSEVLSILTNDVTIQLSFGKRCFFAIICQNRNFCQLFARNAFFPRVSLWRIFLSRSNRLKLRFIQQGFSLTPTSLAWDL